MVEARGPAIILSRPPQLRQLPQDAPQRPPWRDALIALIAFAAVGAALLDDYGVSMDESAQRSYGEAAIAYVLGDAGALPADHNRYYGVAFEAPLVLIERLLGLTDSRAVYLSRHLLTHLFFLTGGFFCWLLTFRLFRDRRLALFALLLFLLQPRLYAHSFFNTKDIPFLAMFMIALYLVQRAFRRDTAAAFALCGVGVGVLVNLRVMGLLLCAAVPALRALDLIQAGGPAERRRVLATAGVFLLAAAATLYAVSPYLWRNPLELADAVVTLAQHPARIRTLFQGTVVRWPEIPPHYLPTWMAITTPPAALLLSLAGIGAVLARGLTRPSAALRNTPVTRFGVLLVACPILSIAAVIAVNANLYKGWHHMYFLAAPLCLLAVYGLRRLLAAAGRRRWLRRGVYALAAAGMAAAAVEMALIHPHQIAYFNFLVDRRTPEYLRTRYEMEYWGSAYREGLEYLLRHDPQATIHVVAQSDWRRAHVRHNLRILPAAERRRIVFTDRAHDVADHRYYVITSHARADHFRRFPLSPVVYARRIYHNTILTVATLDPSPEGDTAAAAFRAADRAARSGEPTASSHFDLYLDGATLTYLKERCAPEDVQEKFFLHVFPADPADLPAYQREMGFETLDFYLWEGGVRRGGACVAVVVLPDYEFTRIRTGQFVRDGVGSQLWSVEFAAGPTAQRYRQARAEIRSGVWGAPVEGVAPEARAEIRSGAWGAPAARGTFDLYLAGTALAYYKEPCAAEDLRERFFLHLTPADEGDLPPEHRPYGFENVGFDFREYGARLGEACVALVPLPEYAIARLDTGQFISGQGQLWSVEIAAPAAAEPTGRSAVSE